jgi:RsiW-degrading membrane proteinase PrsW (M82 family)
MGELFQTGRIVDLVLALMVVEGVLLAIYHRRRGRGIPAAGLVANLLAGGCLLLAVRAALTHAGWPVVSLWLAAALLAHLADLRSRWRAG